MYFLVGRRFIGLWKAGLIGVALAALVDYFGTKYNLYLYPGGLIYIGRLPLLHLVNTLATTILYLNWLPGPSNKRLLYTAYVSFILLGLEAFMFSVGAIIYPNWKLWYSYFLLLAGLSIIAYLSDYVRDKNPNK
ncbi:MAG: hypothetical protein ACYC4H_14240 [Desulfocucumaceae bacterium]